MSRLLKLTGTNWYEWQKEIETYFMLIGCRGHVSSTKPGGDRGLTKWTRRYMLSFGSKGGHEYHKPVGT